MGAQEAVWKVVLSPPKLGAEPHRPSSFPPALTDAFLQPPKGGGQTRTTLSLEPPLEMGQTSDAGDKWDKVPEWFFFWFWLSPILRRCTTLQMDHSQDPQQIAQKRHLCSELIQWCWVAKLILFSSAWLQVSWEEGIMNFQETWPYSEGEKNSSGKVLASYPWVISRNKIAIIPWTFYAKKKISRKIRKQNFNSSNMKFCQAKIVFIQI